MFNKGIRRLLDDLPRMVEIDARSVRQLLTAAWIDIDLTKEIDADQATNRREELRRLASALEVHAILAADDVQELQACAFVAAEALSICSAPLDDQFVEPWLLGTTRLFERFETALLYLIAGFDANAALAARGLETELDSMGDLDETERRLASTLVSYLRMQPLSASRAPVFVQEESISTSVRARAVLLQTIDSAIHQHLNWLALHADEDQSTATIDRVLQILGPGDHGAAHHADIYHLAALLRAAIGQTMSRALRSIPPPDSSSEIFESFLSSHAPIRPLVWPAALEYADKALPGPSHHAVVNVPTGSGKSSIADLAIAHALEAGWVLYLAPTNALVGQIRRQLFSTFGSVHGVTLFDIRGDGEYGMGTDELPAQSANSRIIVMTPEKCAVLLRNSREIFQDLSLCVIDEAHSLGEAGPRAAVLEVVIAELLLGAPGCRFLLLSALISNPHELATWLADSTDCPSLVISSPWRPTRTLRALAGFDRTTLARDAALAYVALEDLPAQRKKKKFSTQIALLASLQGEWKSDSANDYKLISTTMTATLEVNRRRNIERTGYLNPTTGVVAHALAEAGKRTIVFVSRNRHHCFTIANNMPRLSGNSILTPDVRVLLDLADRELGVESNLRTQLQAGVAIHSSAVTAEERRASEIAFSVGSARILFATGGLGQGLNLPADAVVIAGTEIGHDPTSSGAAKRLRARAQFLNAIGRAGRATISSRSVAVVLPNAPLSLNQSAGNENLRVETDFLEFEDASSTVESQLGTLFASAAAGEEIHDQLTAAEETALALLTHSGLDFAPTKVIEKTFAAYQRNLQPEAHSILASFTRVTEEIIAAHDAPFWTVNAAYRSGMTIEQTALLGRSFASTLQSSGGPTTAVEWIEMIVETLRGLPEGTLHVVLPETAFGSTPVDDLWSSTTSSPNTWTTLVRIMESWIQGQSYFDCVWGVTVNSVLRSSKRGPQDPLPRAIRLLETGISHQMSMIAGCLLAIIDLAEFNGAAEFPITPESKTLLERIPSQLRIGLDSIVALEWFRAGMRPRTLAKTLDRLLNSPDPNDVWATRNWIQGLLSGNAEDLLALVDENTSNTILRLRSMHEV